MRLVDLNLFTWVHPFWWDAPTFFLENIPTLVARKQQGHQHGQSDRYLYGR